jgi:hypothetical protein
MSSPAGRAWGATGWRCAIARSTGNGVQDACIVEFWRRALRYGGAISPATAYCETPSKMLQASLGWPQTGNECRWSVKPEDH